MAFWIVQWSWALWAPGESTLCVWPASGLSRRCKNSIRNDRRCAFKSWLHDLMGHTSLFRGVATHGFFDVRSQKEFMVAYFELQDEKDYIFDSKTELLRADALQARRTWRKARKLALSSQPLSARQRSSVAALECGDLENVCRGKQGIWPRPWNYLYMR